MEDPVPLFVDYSPLAVHDVVVLENVFTYAVVLAFGPIMLLLARSFGAISLWTVSLIAIFLALAEFLVYKRI